MAFSSLTVIFFNAYLCNERYLKSTGFATIHDISHGQKQLEKINRENFFGII